MKVLSDAEAIAYLRDRAPVVTGDGPEAERTATKVARRLMEGRLEHDLVFLALRLMRQHWLPRCKCDWDSERLYDFAEAADKERKAEKAAAEAAERQRQRVAYVEEQKEFARARALERERVAKREADANKVKAIMAALNVGDRQAQRLYKHGTTDPEQAAKIGQAIGVDPATMLRRKNKTGRPPDYTRYFMRVWVDGLTFRDFIESLWLEGDSGLSDKARPLAKSFEDTYDAGEMLPEHFQDYEPFMRMARRIYVGRDTMDATDALWCAFKRWRIAGVTAVALNEADGHEG